MGRFRILALFHGCWLIRLIEMRRPTLEGAARLDRILAAALSCITWFGLIPLIHLLNHARQG